MRDVSSGTGSLKCAWEVRAGLVPGTPMPEHTRRWFLTSDVWHQENEMTEEAVPALLDAEPISAVLPAKNEPKQRH